LADNLPLERIVDQAGGRIAPASVERLNFDAHVPGHASTLDIRTLVVVDFLFPVDAKLPVSRVLELGGKPELQVLFKHPSME
jgi:hypothetical protein